MNIKLVLQWKYYTLQADTSYTQTQKYYLSIKIIHLFFSISRFIEVQILQQNTNSEKWINRKRHMQSGKSVFQPGQNCWVENKARFSTPLIDCGNYYKACLLYTSDAADE